MWYQLQIEQCHRDDVDMLSNQLEESGAVSITLTDKNDDPVLEPLPGTTPLWPDVIINALYTEEQAANEAQILMAGSWSGLTMSISVIADQDWERVWMDDFKPQQFGERLWVCPSWMEPPEPNAVNLILDPGLAFGTGTHPTTSLCLKWLDKANLDNKAVIDYGCGSGILALAALKLGASQVHAVDIDPQALLATENNAASNNIDKQKLIIDYPPALDTSVDLLIANILLGPLVNLRDDFHALLKNHGTLLLSGILSEQVPALIEAYQHKFILQKNCQADGWSMLEFKAC